MNHVPHDLLLRFTEGDLDENLAVHIADHIDGCPTCLARAAALEPLTGVLAEVPDPEPPSSTFGVGGASLVDAILAAASAPDVAGPQPSPEPLRPLALPAADLPAANSRLVPWTEIGLGLGMLSLAAGLSLAADPAARAILTDPAEVLSRIGVAIGMLESAGHALKVGLGAGTLGLGMATAMALFGLFVTARLALEGGGVPPGTWDEPEGGVA